MPRFIVRRRCSPEQHYWIGSPEQLPACGGLPVDRTGLLDDELYVSQLVRPSLRAKTAPIMILLICNPAPGLTGFQSSVSSALRAGIKPAGFGKSMCHLTVFRVTPSTAS